MFDPEGEIMTEVRKLRGEDFVIAVSFDLHANNTVRRATSADIIVGYHTNPHRDHFETGYKTTSLLLRTVAGEIDPVMVVNKMPLLKGGVGETVSMNLGGKIDTVYSHPYIYEGEIIFKEETSNGKTMIVYHEGISLVVSELPMSLRDPDEYKDLGLKIMKADIVVVKNLFPFRYKYLLQNRKTVNVITPGLSNIRVEELNYQYIPRPIYPLDDVSGWRKVLD